MLLYLVFIIVLILLIIITIFINNNRYKFHKKYTNHPLLSIKNPTR